MKKRGVGIFLIILGILWALLGIFVYAAVIPTIGPGCGFWCFQIILGIIIPSAILLILGILLTINKKS